MSPTITNALLLFIALYGVTILVELALTRRVKRFVVQAVLLAAVFIVLNRATGFPTPKIAFGGVSPVLAIGVMFICTVLGIAAHYFFYLSGRFSWQSLLKPLFISPIVLLPLIGSVQGASRVESVQLISFGFLAFQNGFFWKVVFEHATKRISEPPVADPAAD